ncbi:hypothetical protein K435DRAFT_782378 [Dendrothele bispora CBS 962.96]|uniref:DUF6593 domain-containing protein n=1 Tax=Dendrothele bispora (strain CBS 962.96) TaxID=1314807 RepID=A0A4S8LFK9_DENBC|nr:hypothetical protein K435DRAFT_782378 [Dendrothele bispora CBS 962.96]
MESFSFSNCNLFKSTILGSSDEPMYTFHPAKNIVGMEKSSKLHIDKVKSSGEETDPEKESMATVEHHNFRSDVVKIWGKEMKPLHWHDKPRKLLFTSTLDGKEYEWSTENQGKTFKLGQKIIPGTSGTDVEWKEIAFFQWGGHNESSENSDRPHPQEATLYAHPEGLDMLDEIMPTFIYFLMVKTGESSRKQDSIALQLAVSPVAGPLGVGGLGVGAPIG